MLQVTTITDVSIFQGILVLTDGAQTFSINKENHQVFEKRDGCFVLVGALGVVSKNNRSIFERCKLLAGK